ncbi:unnamed protein product [Staurois parvus]|uniref:Uncharacterized protein n=1 Tax=Staurois parvus TaxID=386267 RepID=A0ABN9BU26_9NEOB|nr:unnamed protein product [Staurois parvus]
MHSPKNEKKYLAIHTKLSMCNLPPRLCSIRREGRIREDRIKHSFYTMQKINPLSSTVSIASMLYCIYRLILLLWV